MTGGCTMTGDGSTTTGCGLDIDGWHGVDDCRLRGDHHRDRSDDHGLWQSEPHGDMHAFRVGGAREGQGSKPANSHDTQGP
jgi:hypothetical protein